MHNIANTFLARFDQPTNGLTAWGFVTVTKPLAITVSKEQMLNVTYASDCVCCTDLFDAVNGCAKQKHRNGRKERQRQNAKLYTGIDPKG
jgi:hypothetical protein